MPLESTQSPQPPGVPAAADAPLQARVQELEAAMTRLTGNIGHDLRAPLRVASGFLSMLEEDHGAAMNEDGLHLLAVAQRQLAHMEVLLAALLALAEADSAVIEPAPLPMARMVTEIAALATSDGGVTLEIGSLADACGDRALVAQVWRALLDNAYRFTRSVAHPVITISSRRSEGMVRYSVRDNGIGFERSRAGTLFEPFTRLHPSSEDGNNGAGCGLAIARRIIVRHGGSIDAHSRPQHGTTVEFSLPAAP